MQGISFNHGKVEGPHPQWDDAICGVQLFFGSQHLIDKNNYVLFGWQVHVISSVC
jgi:hypothetical protein